jgi:hypothetical protein
MKLLVPFVSREGIKSVVSLLKDCILVNLKTSKSKDLLVCVPLIFYLIFYRYVWLISTMSVCRVAL